MSVTESQRHALFEAAKAVFGESNAETFMNLQPNVDFSDLATKADLAVMRAELRSEMADLRSEFATLRSDFGDLKADFGDLKADFGDLKADFGDLKADFGDLKADFGGLRAEVASLRSDLTSELHHTIWMAQGSFAAIVSAVFVLVAALM